MQKSNLLAVFATASTLAASVSVVPVAQAATQYSPTHIYLNSQDVTNPVHTSAVDPSSHQSTAFMPIYYAMQVLKQLGIQSGWDGHTWSLTVPSSLNPDMSNPSNGANQMSISINGTVVQTAPKVVAVDPSSGQKTTFIPIWYLEQALNRVGVSSKWDGTNWTMTTNVSGETQQAMANAMWNTFAGVSFDVNSHPSMSAVGISPTSSTVTAGDVSDWLSQWAAKAKGVTINLGPQNGKYVPYSLEYETSTNPYTWASENDLFQGTSVSSASSELSTTDAQTVLSNLQWWLTGDKVVNGVNHLHFPFYSDYMLWASQPQNEMSLYGSTLANVIHYYNEITTKTSGSTIDLTLPNTTNSTSDLGWIVNDGNYQYGGWQTKDNRGGTTIQVPNKGTAGLAIAESSLIPNLNLEGCSIAYFNHNGTPDFSQPYNTLLNQPMPN